MKRFNCFKLWLVVLFLALPQTFVFADYDCTTLPPEKQFDSPDCNDSCSVSETCEPNIDPDANLYCCVDVTSVPELPSWFGPFFLATLVAGWEYWRSQRRKAASVRSLKRD